MVIGVKLKLRNLVVGLPQKYVGPYLLKSNAKDFKVFSLNLVE